MLRTVAKYAEGYLERMMPHSSLKRSPHNSGAVVVSKRRSGTLFMRLLDPVWIAIDAEDPAPGEEGGRCVSC